MKKALLFLSLLHFTNCFSQTILLSENFSSGTLPLNWITYNTQTPSVGWEFGTSLGSTGFNIPPYGTYAACNDDKYDNATGTANLCEKSFLISPVVNCSGTDSLTISFDYVASQNLNGDCAIEFSSNGTTFNYAYGLSESNSWTHYQINLPSAFRTANFRFRFYYSDNNTKASGLAVTNIVLYDPPSVDLEITRSFHSDIMPTQNAFTGYRIKNNGLNAITSFTENVFVDGILASTQNYSGLSLNFQKSDDYKISSAIGSMSPGMHTIGIELTNINGLAADENPGNNVNSFQANAIPDLPARHPVLLDKTGAWCTFCADGSLQLDNSIIAFPEAIGVAIHGGDEMDSSSGVWTGGVFAGTLYSGGYPKAGCDAYKFPDYTSLATQPANFQNLALERSLMYEPVEVQLKDVIWNSTTQTVTATVEASVFDTVSGDLRLNFWVVANELYGTGPDWDQVNSSNTDVGHPYYGLGNPILGFRHHHVLMSMQGGAWGTDNIFPDSCVRGSVYRQSYSMQIPSTFWGAQNQTNLIDSSNITLIGLVQNYDADILNRRILNAVSAPLMSLITGTNDLDAENNISLYPNPVVNNFTIRADDVVKSVSLYDGAGRIVSNQNYNSKQIVLFVNNISPGIYFVNIQLQSGKMIRKKIVVQ
ncbi:MAG: T9SS type A sorting domain-containing protein [Bacteroidota bacterium]